MSRNRPALHHLRRFGAVAVLALLALTGCGGSEPAATIDREAFIATYVDLRMAALDTDSARIGAQERDEILRAHGVTADDLEAFADIHGAQLEYMRDVWAEVEVRLDSQAAETNEPGA